MKKYLGVIAVAIVAMLAITGCGANKSTSTSDTDKKTIIVGASPIPHAEILEKVKPILAKEGYTLKIKVFNDYVQPNKALNDGDIDANFFQHIPYLNTFNKEQKTDLVPTVKVHIEPMGVYSKKIKSLKDLKDGAQIAIPNDATNGSRALQLLEKAGLIKVKKVDLPTVSDITENKKNLKFTELDAAQLPRTLDDVDAAVINANYALQANLNPTKDALYLEAKDSPYANVIAVKKGNENKAYIKALDKAINSPEIKKFIEDKYKGSIVPAF
ncbi:D-methionine transport system substrate-binding protein [Clostridium acidisoli DSM 12555]|uniref:Lipoprotein n=1 Tax=Clostridium acidisoli DSM 12555 TaxID=1121291 RepID=A0A1W1XK99_9CLOT|nr:MetQ/NlpA family ABC transporter substrate-binding protein [Clostridium acidisoli]SMC24409.1 D-methionine transport system substrate-binding protein [Clostridium acidisoli DSM 12555]